MLCRISKQLLSLCNLIVADAYFSKESFVTGVKGLGFNIISRFRDDVNLKYLYRGPKARKRGRPQKFAGKIDLKHHDMDIFKEEYSVDDKLVYKLYTATQASEEQTVTEKIWSILMEVIQTIAEAFNFDQDEMMRAIINNNNKELNAVRRAFEALHLVA